MVKTKKYKFLVEAITEKSEREKKHSFLVEIYHATFDEDLGLAKEFEAVK